ncbi:HlyD family efflux transporter periplasmic adaptor subunit [Lachnospiraceae bacterium ZAX-1]
MANKQNQKKKSHKKLWIILAIVLVVIVIAVIFVVRTIGNITAKLDEAMNGNTAIVETGEIAVITEGIGVVQTINSTQEMIDYTSVVKNLYKQDGEYAAKGEIIAEFESVVLDESITQLENQLATINEQLSYSSKTGKTSIQSPVDGRVKKIMAEEGDSVLTVMEQKEALLLISADGKLKVEFEPTKEAAVSIGQKVLIAYADKQIDARISQIKGNVATAVFEDGNTYDVDVDVSVLTEDGLQVGSGQTACGHPIAITADSGIIDRVSVSTNDKISAGKQLFRLKEVDYSTDYVKMLDQREALAKKIEKAKEYKQGFLVTAKTDGIISEMVSKEGDTIPAGTAFYKLLDTANYQISIGIDELDIQGISKGQPVDVTVDAMEDTIYEGEVSGISLRGENNNGVATYLVSILLKNTGSLLPGMSANGKITIDKKTDALLIPINAIQTIDGEKTVTVIKDDQTTEERKVTLGLVNNAKAEVLEGLSAGEQVQLIIKLQDLYEQMGMNVNNGNTAEEYHIEDGNIQE